MKMDDWLGTTAFEVDLLGRLIHGLEEIPLVVVGIVLHPAVGVGQLRDPARIAGRDSGHPL